MSTWQEINRVFEEADKLKYLEELYMERGNVTSEQARLWALEKWKAAKRLPKPRPGQTWTFGINGRPDTITRISRGAVGKWSLQNGHFTPPKGKQAAMWIHWKSGFATITTRELLTNWVYKSL